MQTRTCGSAFRRRLRLVAALSQALPSLRRLSHWLPRLKTHGTGSRSAISSGTKPADMGLVASPGPQGRSSGGFFRSGFGIPGRPNRCASMGAQTARSPDYTRMAATTGALTRGSAPVRGLPHRLAASGQPLWSAITVFSQIHAVCCPSRQFKFGGVPNVLISR